MDVGYAVESWKKTIGIDKLRPYDSGEVDWALNVGKELSAESPQEIERALITLSNYLIFVSYQMGVCYARIKYLEEIGDREKLTTQRVQFHIIKPFHDSIEAKIAVVKKIHERKLKELGYASSSRS